MGFIKGQQLLYMSPHLCALVDFVENDEGWPKLRFMDESTVTVRPSYVRPLNERTMGLLLERYAEAILDNSFDKGMIGRQVDRVADAIRFTDTDRIAAMHEMAGKEPTNA